MKRLFFVVIAVLVLSVSAFAVDLAEFEVTQEDGTTYVDYDSYHAAVAAEKVAAAGLDLNLDSYWVTDWLGTTYFDNDAFETDYVAAIAPPEPVGGDTGDNLDYTPSDSPYPVGSVIDEEGNVFSPDGELLGSGTTPAAPAGTYDQTSDPLLVDPDAGSLIDNSALPSVYAVSDLRSGGDPAGSLVSGLKALIISIFGEYEPVLTTAAVTETVDNVTTTTLIDVVADGAAGVDFEWLSGVFLFGILLYCLMKLLGGILK